MSRSPKDQFDNYAAHMANAIRATERPKLKRPRRSFDSGSSTPSTPPPTEAAVSFPDVRDDALAAAEAENSALRRENEQLRAAAEAPLLPAPDALMADYGPVGDDITGDMLLEAFEDDEAATAAVVQTLTALRLKHLSEQLNVERARLDREHQATGIANPRSASIDRLLGLLTRRGEV